MLFFGFVDVQCWEHPSGFDSLIPRLRIVFKLRIFIATVHVHIPSTVPGTYGPVEARFKGLKQHKNCNFENSKRKFQTLKR